MYQFITVPINIAHLLRSVLEGAELVSDDDSVEWHDKLASIGVKVSFSCAQHDRSAQHVGVGRCRDGECECRRQRNEWTSYHCRLYLMFRDNRVALWVSQQACKHCSVKYEVPMVSEYELARKLEFLIQRDESTGWKSVGKVSRPQTPHISALCELCDKGICMYAKREERERRDNERQRQRRAPQRRPQPSSLLPSREPTVFEATMMSMSSTGYAHSTAFDALSDEPAGIYNRYQPMQHHQLGPSVVAARGGGRGRGRGRRRQQGQRRPPSSRQQQQQSSSSSPARGQHDDGQRQVEGTPKLSKSQRSRASRRRRRQMKEDHKKRMAQGLTDGSAVTDELSDLTHVARAVEGRQLRADLRTRIVEILRHSEGRRMYVSGLGGMLGESPMPAIREYPNEFEVRRATVYLLTPPTPPAPADNENEPQPQ